MAASLEVHLARMYAETNDIPPNENGFGPDKFRISADLLAILGQKCRGLADGRRVDTWARVARKYNHKTVAGRVRRFEQLSGRLLCPRRRSIGDSDAGHAACVICMLPKWAKESVHLHAQDSWGLDALVERIRTLGASRVDGPVRTEVRAIEQDGWDEHAEVLSTGTSTGRWGPWARECPPAPGVEKRGKNGGKGGNKGSKGGKGSKGIRLPQRSSSKGKGKFSDRGDCWKRSK